MAGAIVNKFWEVFGVNQNDDEEEEEEYIDEEVTDEEGWITYQNEIEISCKYATDSSS